MHRNGYKGCFFKFTWLGAGGSSCYLHYFNLIHASRTYNVTSPLRWLGSVRCNKRSASSDAYASGLNRRGDPGVCELVSTREWAKNSNSIYKNSSLSLSLSVRVRIIIPACFFLHNDAPAATAIVTVIEQTSTISTLQSGLLACAI